jgi:hypothetical protein
MTPAARYPSMRRPNPVKANVVPHPALAAALAFYGVADGLLLIPVGLLVVAALMSVSREHSERTRSPIVVDVHE